jgi:hypothetical protein
MPLRYITEFDAVRFAGRQINIDEIFKICGSVSIDFEFQTKFSHVRFGHAPKYINGAAQTTIMLLIHDHVELL